MDDASDTARPLSIAKPSGDAVNPLLTEVFDRWSTGFVLIDRSHAVLWANKAFESTADGDLLRVEDGRLKVGGPLRRLFEERMERLFMGGSARPLHFGEIWGDLALVFQGVGHAPNGRPEAAMVSLLDLRHGVPNGQWICEMFDLTAAEGRVLQAIAAGRTAEEVAEALQISVNTVRTHLHRIFSKTGFSTQASLVRLTYLLPVR